MFHVSYMRNKKEGGSIMKKLLTLASCLLLCATVLTGCGGGNSNDGILNVGVGGDTAIPDPAIVDDSITANILAQTYEGLYKLDTEGKPQPLLATAEPVVSEDGLTYTITLVDGVKWSDGQPLKAEDFVYAWKRAASIGNAKAYYSQFITNYIQNAPELTPIDEMTDFGAVAKDDKTIEITLTEKCPFFAALLTNTVFYPVRKDFVEANADSATSSDWALKVETPTLSAYKYTAIETKDEIALEKNENYYAADKVKIEKVSFKVMADQDSETNAFATGELDFATSVNKETALKNHKDNVYVIDPFVCNYYILVNAGEENDGSTEGLAALKDPEIRKAISLGIDRSAILKTIGYGDLAYELAGIVPKGIPGATGDFREEADSSEKLATTNVEEAKKIMEAKGYSADKMLTIKYSYNENAMHKNAAQSMQASLKEVYINLELTPTEKEAFFDQRDKGQFELARHAMTADFIDPMAYFSMYVNFNLAGNTVDDATYEGLIAEANKLEGAERMNALHEAEKYLIQEQNYIIPLFGYSEPFLLNSDVKGITSSPEGHYDLRFASFE